jgi:hypothetical protein
MEGQRVNGFSSMRAYSALSNWSTSDILTKAVMARGQGIIEKLLGVDLISLIAGELRAAGG